MVSIFFSYKLILYFRYKHLVDEGEERIQIPLKVGHHRRTSKTPFTQLAINMGPIWVPCGHPYGTHIGSATGFHMGPIWAGPCK